MRDEVIAYLEQYAQASDLPIELNSRVRKLRANNGRFVLEADGRTVTPEQVVIATGPFQTPHVPEIAKRLGSPHVFQTHSTGYQRPSDVPDGTVLVVGGGNTGFQIAEELTATHKVTSRSARVRRRCRSGSSAAISSGGSRSRACSRQPSSHGSGAGCNIATRSSARARGAETPWRRAEAPWLRGRPYESASPTGPTSRSTRWSGRRATAPTIRGSICPCSTTGTYATAVV